MIPNSPALLKSGRFPVGISLRKACQSTVEISSANSGSRCRLAVILDGARKSRCAQRRFSTIEISIYETRIQFDYHVIITRNHFMFVSPLIVFQGCRNRIGVDGVRVTVGFLPILRFMLIAEKSSWELAACDIL